MSPSMMPTRLPSFASAMARWTATVVLPPPPLPAPTAMMLRIPGIGARPPSGTAAERTMAVMSTSTDVTPARPRACDGDALPKAKADDVLVEIGILDHPEGVQHSGLRHRRRTGEHPAIVPCRALTRARSATPASRPPRRYRAA